MWLARIPIYLGWIVGVGFGLYFTFDGLWAYLHKALVLKQKPVKKTKLAERFYSAGMEGFPVTLYRTSQGISALVLFGLGEFYTGTVVLAGLLGILGLFVPGMAISFLISRRKNTMNRMVRVVIGSLAGAIETEGSAYNALQRLMVDTPEPLHSELKDIFANAATLPDYSVADGIYALAHKLDNRDLIKLSKALQMDSTVGGPTGSVILKINDGIRTKERMRANRRAETAGGAMIAWMFTILPIGAFLFAPIAFHKDFVFWRTTLVGHIAVGVFLVVTIFVVNLINDVFKSQDLN